jgi:hypothetical protein
MWFAHPLIYYGFLAAGINICLFLFLTMKREMKSLECRTRRQLEACETEAQQMRRTIEELRSAIQGQEERQAAAAAAPANWTGMNITRRAQVLRMYRRGERPEQIAAALGLPQNEVDLLLKLHAAVTGAVQATAASEMFAAAAGDPPTGHSEP